MRALRKSFDFPKVLFLVGMKTLKPFVEEAIKADEVTEALNHILKGMPMN